MRVRGPFVLRDRSHSGASPVIIRNLVAGVAIAALAAGAASAHKTRHHVRHSGGGSAAFAEPAQPIPYAELDHYLHASPRERASIAMASANTGGSANTSATTTTDTTAPAAAPPPSATPDTGAVNPPNGATTSGGDATGGSGTPPKDQQVPK
jgi:hypothetical protein